MQLKTKEKLRIYIISAKNEVAPKSAANTIVVLNKVFSNPRLL